MELRPETYLNTRKERRKLLKVVTIFIISLVLLFILWTLTRFPDVSGKESIKFIIMGLSLYLILILVFLGLGKRMDKKKEDKEMFS